MSKTTNPLAGSWYSIRARTVIAAAAQGVQSAAEILIYGDIGESWWGDTVSAAQFVKDIGELDVKAITVRINSYGGSVTDGIAIHNAIKRHDAHVTVSIDGIAASIASLIAMAGDTVEMAENAQMMIHAPWGGVMGNAQELREYADMLDGWSESMATSYASKSGMQAADVLALLKDGKDHWYTAAKSLELGLVDAVVSAAPEAASAMASLNAEFLTRYRTAPASLVQRIPAAPAAQTKETSMKPNDPAGTIPTAATAEEIQAAATKAAAAALAADQARRTGISAKFAKPIEQGLKGAAELMAKCADDQACTVQAAGEQLLALYAAGATPIAGHVSTVEDETDKRVEAQAQSIMARAGVNGADGKRVIALTSNPFRGFKMLDLARASLQAAGVKTDGMDQMKVVGLAFTQGTGDFPILLENVMHKTLQAAYAVAPDTWTRFCARGSVSDFRAHNRYRVGSLSNLETKNELGEFRNKSIPDGEKASITAATKGNIINISREAVINDDLGAFVGMANALGRAAKRTVEADVYTALLSNSGAGPLLSDGLALFHATHNNLLASGTVISTASVDLMRQAMGSQLDVGGNDYLDIMPTIWLGPLSLGGLAREVNGAEYNDDSNKLQRKPNIVRGLFKDIVDTPRLTGLPWYTFADPNVAPVMEVAFLDGNDTPYLEMQQGFTVDGSAWKVRLDFGIAGVDYRGARKNPGA